MKAQVWMFDFIAALLIVIVAVGIFWQFALSPRVSTDVLPELYNDALRVSEYLVTEGSPSDWDNNTVNIVGITDNNWRINNTKLDQLYSLSNTKLRQSLGITSRFSIEIYNQSTPIVVNGKNLTGSNPSNARHLVSISRLLIFNSSLVEMRISTWQ